MVNHEYNKTIQNIIFDCGHFSLSAYPLKGDCVCYRCGDKNIWYKYLGNKQWEEIPDDKNLKEPDLSKRFLI